MSDVDAPPLDNAHDDSDDPQRDPTFAPGNPTDGRQVGDWKTRYTEPAARKCIRLEASYVGAVVAFALAAQLAVALRFPRPQTGLSVEEWDSLAPFVIAFFGGVLGGGLFATKWLYHTVARGTWNQDRWLWRIYTPLLSGGAALTIVLLSAGRIVPLFGEDLVRTKAGAAGIAILFGYFSDRTFSALENLAGNHLGAATGKERESSPNGGDN